ncbi:hypothetical protein [Paraburkholderia sp. BR10954]|uniref:hypothetical protein n=1 Tax=Paraburkholderia sp. BR10954 TaxID=3236995 RepID=UPI0034D2D755
MAHTVMCCRYGSITLFFGCCLFLIENFLRSGYVLVIDTIGCGHLLVHPHDFVGMLCSRPAHWLRNCLEPKRTGLKALQRKRPKRQPQEIS